MRKSRITGLLLTAVPFSPALALARPWEAASSALAEASSVLSVDSSCCAIVLSLLTATRSALAR